MKKTKNNKLNVAVDDEIQSEMSAIRDEFGVNWSEKIRRFIKLEIKIIREGKEDDFKKLICKAYEEMQSSK